ncbi:nucleoside monophosphate kinase [bacterium]|nr:nucleoside monophosphate kinase [bacterium]
MRKKTLNIVLLGPQGSGKGTEAQLLSEKYNLVHLEVGRILRKIARSKTPLGKKVDDLINKQGKMVPLKLLLEVIEREIKKIPRSRGIIFDGTPRRLGEIKPLERILKECNRKLTHIFYLPISEKETARRLSKRRICSGCGKIFTVGININAKTKKCPICGGKIIKRPDDRPKAIKERLKLYRKETLPVVRYYKKQGKLIKINAQKSIKDVFKEIVNKIEKNDCNKKSK